MKKTLLLLSLTGFILSGCHDHDHGHDHDNCIVVHKCPPHQTHDSDYYCQYIPVDTANAMISSYLNSIHYQTNDSDLHALVYNADSLRAYLSDQRIVSVKFMLAHTMDYIDGGGRDQYAGYQDGALTFVIAGYDAQGNYIFYYYPKTNTAMVKDHCQPCPTACPSGQAASNFLPNSSQGHGKH